MPDLVLIKYGVEVTGAAKVLVTLVIGCCQRFMYHIYKIY